MLHGVESLSHLILICENPIFIITVETKHTLRPNYISAASAMVEATLKWSSKTVVSNSIDFSRKQDISTRLLLADLFTATLYDAGSSYRRPFSTQID